MECDAWVGLIPVESGTGCVLRVQVGLADHWQHLGGAYGLVVLMLLVALVVAQAGRR